MHSGSAGGGVPWGSLARITERGAESLNPRWQRQRPAPASTSAMMAGVWALPKVGRVTLTTAPLQDLQELDATWPRSRPNGDVAEGWRWYEVGCHSADRFCLRADDGGILAVWAAERSGTHLIGGVKAYRLDRLEVHPEKRRLGIGALAMALIAKRTYEHGGAAVVLGAAATPGTISFYQGLGGTPGPVHGWSAPPDLIPFRFDDDALSALVEHADDHQA